MEKLVLIDGNSLMNRAFYATPVFTTKSGVPTNGVFGFVKLLLKIISDKKPSYLAVAFDVHAPTFRHKMYDAYKAGRKPMPDDLAAQMPILKDVLKLMGIKICELPGYEADDIIGTLSKKFNVHSYIYTGDRDSYQLVDEKTNVCFTRKGVSDILELAIENFKDEIGITPSQVIDLKALMGDKSDNIPGIAGVGEKTAVGLITQYDNLDGIYANTDKINGALHKKIVEGKEAAYFSAKLATIDTNVPLDITLSECLVNMPFDYSVKEKFAELEFKSLLDKNIFKSAEESCSATNIEEKAAPVIREVIVESINDAILSLETNAVPEIAIDWQEEAIRIFPITENSATEYVFPIKLGLLDVGFFDYQISPILQYVFRGDKRVVGYNFKDILHRLAPFGVSPCERFDDVAILKCLAEGAGNTDSLEYCLSANSLSEKHRAYGLAALRDIYYAQLNEEEKALYEKVELPLSLVLFEMEEQGVCIDTKTLDEISDRYNNELKALVEKIYDLAGETFNVNSTQQLGKILFEKLKIGDGAKKRKESKAYKTTAEELEKYADSSEIVRYLLRYRKIQKLNSTYLEGFKPLVKSGKVHTTYNQNNTLTGRLSSANPNLQNIPIRTDEGRELRKLFIASEGNVLIDADYSQIELRLLAHFSECKELIEAYNSNADIHAITASQVFGVPLEEVTSDLRRQAKAVNFGIIYGISAFGLSNDLHITPKMAQEYIARYYESYSNVKNYMDGNVKKATDEGYVKTLLGRRRVINELKASNYNVRSFGERAAMNMPLQGSSADIIKIAMINVNRKLKKGKFKAKLVLQVHDELVIDCPKEEEKAVTALLKHEMENAVSLLVPLTVDVGIGENWFETK